MPPWLMKRPYPPYGGSGHANCRELFGGKAACPLPGAHAVQVDVCSLSKQRLLCAPMTAIPPAAYRLQTLKASVRSANTNLRDWAASGPAGVHGRRPIRTRACALRRIPVSGPTGPKRSSRSRVVRRRSGWKVGPSSLVGSPALLASASPVPGLPLLMPQPRFALSAERRSVWRV